MTTPNTTADKFALLFSADWFRPHWTLTGFVPSEGNAFQRDARDLVGRMMDGATSYWHIDFSEARLAETRDGLLSAIDRHHAQHSNLSLIHAMVEGGPLDAAMADVSMTFWDDYERSTEEIRRAELRNTEWDRRLVALTPDLPSFLQDFAVVTLLGGGI